MFTKEFLESFGASLAEISRLAERGEGWDSYGASRIEPQARENAVQFLRFLQAIGGRVPPPIVGASASGVVVLQWLSAESEVYVEIAKTTFEYYVARPDQDAVIIEGALNELKDLASRLYPFLAEPSAGPNRTQ
ncbi:MAG: hypothetical protein HY652_14540 [Acidobacteria bacterium]|nr:hypothetical protein [Acidobacteriota bacterium]